MKVIQMKNSDVRIPKQDRGIITRNKIIEAATNLFSEKGYSNTNTKEIAREAGVSVGCFYSYFADKKAVFFECVKLYIDEYNQMFEKEIANLTTENISSKEMMKHLIKVIIKAHNVFMEFHNEALAGSFTDPEMKEFVANTEKKNLKNIYHYLVLFKTKLRVADITTAAWVVYKSTQAVVDSIVFSELEVEKERIIDELADMLAQYLFIPLYHQHE